MADFDQFILPGMTHWQHPRFFAYFPSNAAPPSILADFLSATLSSQGILWQMSPAATELETSMMEWMRYAVGLPSEFSGGIQDSASTATVAAVLTMRELALSWKGNKDGLSGHNRLRIYVSDEAHSSVEKADRRSIINIGWISMIYTEKARNNKFLLNAVRYQRGCPSIS